MTAWAQQPASGTAGAARDSGELSPQISVFIMNEIHKEQRPELDRHGKPKLDRDGKPKMKWVNVPKAITRTLDAYTAKVVDVRSFSYLQRTDYSYYYNYVSPACLNTWWCHLLVGDPTAQAVAQPVYGDYTLLALEDTSTGDIYIARQAGSYLLSFAINSTVKYGSYGAGLVVVDNRGAQHDVDLIQKILKPE
jgi:hypothetical protein